MGIPRELLNSLLKYRKRNRRSLGPTIPGYAGQYNTAKPVTRVPGDRQSIPSRPVPRQEEYMSGFPEDYSPHPGFMEMPESDYEQYDSYVAENISHMAGQSPSVPANMAGYEPPEVELEAVNYEDCLMDGDLFEQLIYNSQLEATGIDDYAGGVDSVADMLGTMDLPSLEDLTDALFQLREVFPEDHPDIVLLSTAIQALSYNASMLQSEDPDVGFGPSGAGVDQNPFEADPFQEAEQIFNQQMQLLDQSFEASAFETVEAQDPSMFTEQAMFEQPMFEDGPAINPGPESLDDIVEAHDMPNGATMFNGMSEMPTYDGCPMSQELFDQQMHEAAEQIAPEEASPDPYDNGMVPGEMYGPMPEDMMEPDMMNPEMMDPQMMNPYMMPGPMGPSFMPDPPPGP